MFEDQSTGAIKYINCIYAEGVDLIYDIKLSDGEAPLLELWVMWSISSWPLLPGWLRPGVVAPERLLSLGQIEPFDF